MPKKIDENLLSEKWKWNRNQKGIQSSDIDLIWTSPPHSYDALDTRLYTKKKWMEFTSKALAHELLLRLRLLAYCRQHRHILAIDVEIGCRTAIRLIFTCGFVVSSMLCQCIVTQKLTRKLRCKWLCESCWSDCRKAKKATVKVEKKVHETVYRVLQSQFLLEHANWLLPLAVLCCVCLFSSYFLCSTLV